VGRAQGPHARERADAVVHRPASDPRSHEPAGVRHDAPARLDGRVPGAHGCDHRSHRPDELAEAAVPRPDGRRDDRGARAQLQRVRHQALPARPDGAGHRPRHRPAAGADTAGHDDRVRRQPHVHARRLRRDCDGHRDVAGARRPGLAVPRRRAAEGAAHRRQRPPAARRVREGRHPDDHPHARRPGRRRLRVRVRRRRARPHVDGRAHDDLQHVDRPAPATSTPTTRRSRTSRAGSSRRRVRRGTRPSRGGARWRRTGTRRTTIA